MCLAVISTSERAVKCVIDALLYISGLEDHYFIPYRAPAIRTNSRRGVYDEAGFAEQGLVYLEQGSAYPEQGSEKVSCPQCGREFR